MRDGRENRREKGAKDAGVSRREKIPVTLKKKKVLTLISFVEGTPSRRAQASKKTKLHEKLGKKSRTHFIFDHGPRCPLDFCRRVIG